MNKGTRYVLLAFTLLGTLLFFWGVFNYHMATAQWWGVSIWIFAVPIVALVLGGAWFFDVFDMSEETPKWLVLLLGVFLVVSVCEGIFISEPTIQAQQNHTAQTASSSQGGYHEDTFFFYSWWDSGSSSSSSSHSSSSSSSKGSGYVYLVLIVIALVLLSAIVPNFWIIALLCGLVLLWSFTYKEFKREEVASRRRYRTRYY